MKVSIITWDANFRENLHTIDAFAQQKFDDSAYEFIWVDYYESNDAVRQKIDEYKNCKLVTLGYSSDEEWHLGKCVNAGVKESCGDVLIIPDGDILVDYDFIKNAFEWHEGRIDSISYYRRYDEPEKPALQAAGMNISDIARRTKLINPLNYAGCFSLNRRLFSELEGYEEHDIFSGPGMNAREFYIRARNSGASIRWGEGKLYHPWHESTGVSSIEKKERMILKRLRDSYPWLSPYSGVAQSWVAHCREMNLDVTANAIQVDEYLSHTPEINLDNVETIDDITSKRNELLKENEELRIKISDIDNELSRIMRSRLVRTYLKFISFVQS